MIDHWSLIVVVLDRSLVVLRFPLVAVVRIVFNLLNLDLLYVRDYKYFVDDVNMCNVHLLAVNNVQIQIMNQEVKFRVLLRLSKLSLRQLNTEVLISGTK